MGKSVDIAYILSDVAEEFPQSTFRPPTCINQPISNAMRALSGAINMPGGVFMQIWSFEGSDKNQHVSNHLLIGSTNLFLQANDEVRLTSQSAFRWLGDPFHKRITVQLDRIEIGRVAKAYQSLLKRDVEEIAELIDSRSSYRRIDQRVKRFKRYWELSQADLDELLLQVKSPLDEYKERHYERTDKVA